jgi:14-3-3 protein epsilon
MTVDHVHRLLNTAEMGEFMKRIIIEVKEELTVEEKNLISLAFKNVIGQRRVSYRILSSIEYKEENKGTDTTRIQEYIRVIEKELHDIADEFLSLCDNYLIPHSHSYESQVFWQKARADFLRYIAEVLPKNEEQRSVIADLCQQTYEKAEQIAQNLPTTNPLRLGLALNFSTFMYEIANDSATSLQIQKAAFDAAVSDLDLLDADEYKATTENLQILSPPLKLWKIEPADPSN